ASGRVAGRRHHAQSAASHPGDGSREMMPPAFNSLKSRLLLSMLGVVLLTVALVSVTVVGSQRDVAYRQAEAELRSLGGMLAINTTAALLFGDSFAAQRSLEGFSSLP